MRSRVRPSNLPQSDVLDYVVLTLFKHQMRTFASRPDIFPQIRKIDLVPDPGCRFDCFGLREVGVPPEIRELIAEHGLAQAQETIHIPRLNGTLLSVEVNREIEVIRDENARGVPMLLG